MSIFSFVPPARPWMRHCPPFLHFLHPVLAPGMWHFSAFFSTVFRPLPGRSAIEPAAFAPNTFHKHLPLLLFLCAHGLLRMHSRSHAACIYPLLSVQSPRSYTHQLHTNQLLHQPAFMTSTLFTLNTFAENPLLHQPVFLHNLL